MNPFLGVSQIYDILITKPDILHRHVHSISAIIFTLDYIPSN